MLPMNNDLSEKAVILIIDDSPTNLKILLRYLKESGFEIRMAEHGEAGLAQLETLRPDIILLDVMMPGIDGFETCRRLKEKPETKDIPVIFMTSLSEISNKIKGFNAGAVDYITKPFRQEEVLARVNTHLTILRQRNEILRQKEELEKALAEIKVLKGLLPICSHCKKIRDDKGGWEPIEVYIRNHSEAKFSHGICPSCARELYPDFYKQK
jgi:DNA-binding response OmpR family regulator